MTTTARVGAAQIHFLVILAMAIAPEATREFKSATPEAVTSRDEMIMAWLKVTAVPLGVLLMGACLWGCIKNSVWWRAFLEVIAYDPRGLSIAPEADAIQLAAGLPNSSSQHESDGQIKQCVSRYCVKGRRISDCTLSRGDPEYVRFKCRTCISPRHLTEAWVKTQPFQPALGI